MTEENQAALTKMLTALRERTASRSSSPLPEAALPTDESSTFPPEGASTQDLPEPLVLMARSLAPHSYAEAYARLLVSLPRSLVRPACKRIGVPEVDRQLANAGSGWRTHGQICSFFPLPFLQGRHSSWKGKSLLRACQAHLLVKGAAGLDAPANPASDFQGFWHVIEKTWLMNYSSDLTALVDFASIRS